MNDTIIKINVREMYGPYLTMTIDLHQIALLAGRRVEDDKGRHIVDYHLPRARKLIRLILKYGTEEDFVKCEAAFKINTKLYTIWDNLSGSQWKDWEPVVNIPF